jgi:hypothetical protein
MCSRLDFLSTDPTLFILPFYLFSLKEADAKSIHTSLRKAAGVMIFVQDTLLPQLVERPQVMGNKYRVFQKSMSMFDMGDF